MHSLGHRVGTDGQQDIADYGAVTGGLVDDDAAIPSTAAQMTNSGGLRNRPTHSLSGPM